MKYKIFLILVLVLFCSFYTKAFAEELCSSKGYTVLTINGIFTDLDGAIYNKDALKFKLKKPFNNQKINVDYLYNPTHLAGMGDFVDAIRQGAYVQKSDYDLVEMLNDASRKVTTQKLLLVGHSQGNFYANNFYEKVASQEGGIPAKSIGVYGVASPDGWVAGNGRYLTSSTDSLINEVRKILLYTLKANTDIKLSKETDGNGHSFSNVYLKYQGERIVKDIKSSLNKLKENDEQVAEEPCISPPELSTIHKVQKVILAVADPTANVVKGGLVGAYNVGAYIAKGVRNAGLAVGKTLKGLSANVVESLPDITSITTIPPTIGDEKQDDPAISEQNQEPIPEQNSENVEPEAIPSSNEIPESTTPEEDPAHRSGGGGGSSSVPEPVPVPADELPAAEDPIVPTPDIVPPTVAILGENPVNVIKDTIYVDAGAVAHDEVDGVREVTTTGTVDVGVIGTYTITYTAIDLSNNIATVTRTVNVTEVAQEPEDPEPDPEPEPEPEDPEPPVQLGTFTIDEDTTWSAGEYNYENLIITNNAVLTLEGDPASSDDFKGVKINAINLTITTGASISADKKGYGPNQGPGAVQDTSPSSNIGAGYGGLSYSNENGVTYGSATEPIDLGSGGAGLNHGGGAIYIVVSDTITNDGIISSSGGESSSGGSIYVKAEKIKGSGVFRANGGQLYQTGYFKSAGGGGRIALYYDEWSFDGTVEAKGGCGSYDSWTTVCAGDGTAGAFDVPANDLYPKGSWRFLEDDGPFSFHNIFISDEAKVSSENDVSITADNIYIDGNSSFILGDNQILDVPIIDIDGGSTLTLSGSETLTTDTLTVAGDSTVTVITEKILSLEIPNIVIENGSKISANGKGYKNGPGTPSPDLYFAGASYGGIGSGNLSTSVYGSEAEPVDFGSGGYGNFLGGGAIRLVVDDSLVNDGAISADGEFTSSGGSVYITAKNISGNGTFSANGGGSYLSSIQQGPGGGGRVAVYYEELLFTGQTLAYGGTSLSNNPGTGTIKMVDTSVVAPDPEPDPEPDPDPTPEPDPDPTPEPDVILPAITSYIFNGVLDDVTINSLADVTTLVFVANKNVDWVSIKIEKEDDESIFKSFRESSTCADGTDTCTKTWNALLAGDTTAPNGTYKVKVRIRDLSDPTIDYDYFSPYTITVEIPEDAPMEAVMEIPEEVIPTPKPGLGAEGGEMILETL